jgi:aconitase A
VGRQGSRLGQRIVDGTAFLGRARRFRLVRWDGKGGHDLARQFQCAKTLTVGSKTYVYYSLPEAEKHGLRGISRPSVLDEGAFGKSAAHEDGRTVTKEDIQGVAQWLKAKTSDREIAFRPARVLMQDFTGVPPSSISPRCATR